MCKQCNAHNVSLYSLKAAWAEAMKGGAYGTPLSIMVRPALCMKCACFACSAQVMASF